MATGGQEISGAMKLPKEDMVMFGLCPKQDQFILVTCEICGLNVKMQAFQSHMARRHGGEVLRSREVDNVVKGVEGVELGQSGTGSGSDSDWCSDDEGSIETLRDATMARKISLPPIILTPSPRGRKLSPSARQRRFPSPKVNVLDSLISPSKIQPVRVLTEEVMPITPLNIMEYNTESSDQESERLERTPEPAATNHQELETESSDQEWIESTPQPVATRRHSRGKMTTRSESVEEVVDLRDESTALSGPSVFICQYPPPEDVTTDSVSVSMEDYKTLQHGTFINDVIIDFFLKFLFCQKVPLEEQNKVLLLNSMFFKKLTERQDGKEERYLRVENWTKKVDLSEKRVIIIPVCKDSHWFLVVVVRPGKEEGFLLILLDSLERPQEEVIMLVREFLECEGKARGKGWGQMKEVLRPQKPNQWDGTECGAFLLLYGDWVFRNLCRGKLDMNGEWFSSEQVIGLRQEVAKTIRDLTVQQGGENVVFPDLFQQGGEGGWEVELTPEKVSDETENKKSLKPRSSSTSLQTNSLELASQEVFEETDVNKSFKSSSSTTTLQTNIMELLSSLSPTSPLPLKGAGNFSFPPDVTSDEIFHHQPGKRKPTEPVEKPQRKMRRKVPRLTRFTEKEYYLGKGRSGQSEWLFDEIQGLTESGVRGDEGDVFTQNR